MALCGFRNFGGKAVPATIRSERVLREIAALA